ncbi:MAG TPA: glycosyltransferase family 4 protein [Candidatus Thermoplasmatota archaeon]|nr:glycosyltransferase family 4 protein [Candidatus Thermoplasmatota archaeon]
MKVALVGAGRIPIPPPGYGAVEKHIANLAEALRARGHEVHVVNEALGESGDAEYRFALKARRAVAGLAPDVVHVHTPGVALVFSLLGPKRFVFTTHSRHWTTVEGWRERVGFALERRAVRNAARAIAVSPEVGALAGERLGVRAAVIPNGVDVERYAPDASKRVEGLVVGVGEVARHKRWHLAARALKGTGLSLAVAGPIRDPAYANEIEAEGGHTRLLGPMDEAELIDHFRSGVALAHPSVSESFGMAVVEAMSCGLPVVASDILSSLVKHGETGLLVPTEGDDDARAAALRDALLALAADAKRRERLGEAARALAVDRYAWSSIARDVEAVYEEVRGSRP